MNPPKTKPSKVWVIADDRAGNVNQALGVANALGLPYKRIDISYDFFAKLPNLLRGASLLGLKSKNKIKPPYPELVISAGRRSAPILRYIKKQSNNKTAIVQIMYSGDFGRKDFDLIAVPNHDLKAPDDKNILRITGAPHLITNEKLEDAKAKWQSSFNDFPRPFTALFIGGATKDKVFTHQMAQELTKKACEVAGDGSLLITTSRRTGEDIAKCVLATVRVPNYFYKWGDEGENPYLGFMALADRIVVTGDSVSMCSEACFRDVPVYIYAPEEMVSEKHTRLHKELCRNGYARLLKDNNFSEYNNSQLNSAYDVAEKIKEIIPQIMEN